MLKLRIKCGDYPRLLYLEALKSKAYGVGKCRLTRDDDFNIDQGLSANIRQREATY